MDEYLPAMLDTSLQHKVRVNHDLIKTRAVVGTVLLVTCAKSSRPRTPHVRPDEGSVTAGRLLAMESFHEAKFLYVVCFLGMS